MIKFFRMIRLNCKLNALSVKMNVYKNKIDDLLKSVGVNQNNYFELLKNNTFDKQILNIIYKHSIQFWVVVVQEIIDMQLNKRHQEEGYLNIEENQIQIISHLKKILSKKSPPVPLYQTNMRGGRPHINKDAIEFVIKERNTETMFPLIQLLISKYIEKYSEIQKKCFNLSKEILELVD